MIDMWILLQLASIVFLAVCIVITLTNTRNFKKIESFRKSTYLPKVSILVPARNEENNIAGCLVSLLSQDYPNFEIVVLDDESTDRTWDILKALATRNKKLRIYKGEALPDGWIGKHWACHQLVEHAAGDVFLFTDADTRHNRQTLSKAVAAFNAEDADFLTALPREEAHTLGEKLTIPIMSFGISSFLPMKIAHQSPWPVLSLTVGQFMMLRRKAYDEIGGYEAIRHCVLDDVALGRRIKSHGLKWRIVDASNYITCRMYHSLKEVYDGFSKNLFEVFGKNILLYLPVWAWLSLVFIFPVALLGFKIGGSPVTDGKVMLALITVVLSLVLWSMTHLRFRYPVYLTFLYPVSVFLWVFMAMRSMIMTVAGQITWKGRNLDIMEDSIEEETENLDEVRERTS